MFDFPAIPEIVTRARSENREGKKVVAEGFPEIHKCPEVNNGKAYRRFPRFPKCPETGTPDFPAIPAAAIEAAGTITGRENGKDRDRCELMRNTYPHLMQMEALAMRESGWNLSQRVQSLAGQSVCMQQFISERSKRRHLDATQRSAVAAELANMQQGQRTDLTPSANLQNVSQTEAATLLNVSPR